MKKRLVTFEVKYLAQRFLVECDAYYDNGFKVFIDTPFGLTTDMVNVTDFIVPDLRTQIEDKITALFPSDES